METTNQKLGQAKPAGVGTAWTGDGEGLTAHEICTRIVKAKELPMGIKIVYEAIEKLSKLGYSRTNLALTGSPLVAEDIERILSDRFRVGGGK